MKTEKLDRESQINAALGGRRIIFAGLQNEQRQIYEQNLLHLFRQKQIKVQTTDSIRTVTNDDLVLLFGKIEDEHCAELDKSLTQKEKKAGVQQTKRTQLISLMEQLVLLAEKKPAGAVLLSDCLVYGKQFGTPHKYKEEELGYLSHTDQKESALQYMRMAEHLACRLAAEEQLHIRVARQDLRAETENLGEVMEALLLLLLYGADGEIYNLPQSGQPWTYGEVEEGSPLSPLEIRLDTEKADAMASGRG